MMVFLRLFWEFFNTGLFAVGGGMATIPFLYEMSEKTGWFTHGDVANMIAVGESTPGPIGVNMATYVGYITGFEVGDLGTAILGGVVATLGLVAPCVIVILVVAAVLDSFRNSRYVDDAFYGLRPASNGLIAAAGIGVAMSCLFFTGMEPGIGAVNWKSLILGIVLWFLTNKTKKLKKLHPVAFIAFSAVVGIMLGM